MYDYYAITILPTMDFKCMLTNYAKTFEDQPFNFVSQIYFMKISTFYKFFSSMKVFTKVSNNHLYIK
jgi:hypothetical protein